MLRLLSLGLLYCLFQRTGSVIVRKGDNSGVIKTDGGAEIYFGSKLFKRGPIRVGARVGATIPRSATRGRRIHAFTAWTLKPPRKTGGVRVAGCSSSSSGKQAKAQRPTSVREGVIASLHEGGGGMIFVLAGKDGGGGVKVSFAANKAYPDCALQDKVRVKYVDTEAATFALSVYKSLAVPARGSSRRKTDKPVSFATGVIASLNPGRGGLITGVREEDGIPVKISFGANKAYHGYAQGDTVRVKYIVTEHATFALWVYKSVAAVIAPVVAVPEDLVATSAVSVAPVPVVRTPATAVEASITTTVTGPTTTNETLVVVLVLFATVVKLFLVTLGWS